MRHRREKHRERPCEDVGRDRRGAATSQGHLEPPELGEAGRILSEAFQRFCNPVHTLTSHFWPPGLQNEQFLLRQLLAAAWETHACHSRCSEVCLCSSRAVICEVRRLAGDVGSQPMSARGEGVAEKSASVTFLQWRAARVEGSRWGADCLVIKSRSCLVNLIPRDPPGPARGQHSGGFDSFKQADSWGPAIR